MIHESYNWKKELYNSFLTIAKFRHSKRITEQSQVKVEKALLIGAYITRKLDDAQKIPQDFLTKKEQLGFYESKGTIIDLMNRHKIDTHYSFDKVIKSEKDWRFIINQIIHSFSLFFSNDSSDKLDGFLFNSDMTKKQALFFLPLETILTIFLTISEGEITCSHFQRQVLCNDSHGKQKFGEIKLTKTVYSYPDNFDIKIAIANSLKGEIYRRENGNFKFNS
ncbi:hypothetical protein D0X99_06745 [Algoriphagus lacus]|uniref:Uncharacterized protein n=1 Tax=Algoriphagus lacus TaxID=2056311 RepID=A0A418PUQ8_9BACT|nr:hypothetical protein [Algoriphagus lacus]RIW17418.1 hypothetical protein D0X99_06745 [Algoriphagus lacus]